MKKVVLLVTLSMGILSIMRAEGGRGSNAGARGGILNVTIAGQHFKVDSFSDLVKRENVVLALGGGLGIYVAYRTLKLVLFLAGVTLVVAVLDGVLSGGRYVVARIPFEGLQSRLEQHSTLSFLAPFVGGVRAMLVDSTAAASAR